MAGLKWIPNLKRTTRIADAARHVLTLRLEAVRDAVPPVVRHAGRDPEDVHQLRVASRRAGAALDVFADCLPPRDLKTARKRVRKIRQAAGAARDWDVFLADLQTVTPGRRTSDRWRDVVVGFAVARRAEAQSLLNEIGEDFPFAFDRFLAETVAAVHPPRTGVLLRDLANRRIGQLVDDLNRAAGTNTEDFEHLHQVRIFGKRLRYSLEIFGDCLAEPFRDQLYEAIEEVQAILGNANDSFVASRRLEELRGWLETLVPRARTRFRGGLEALLRHHQDRLPRERARFQEWWERWRQAGAGAPFVSALRALENAG